MKSHTNTVKSERMPSGIRVAWKFWRHCCCRNGFYPLVVAPFITASFLLDVFCTLGCGFITLNVGFKPINEAWNEQVLRFGLFNFQSGIEGAHMNAYMDNFHPGCIGFTDTFKEFFVSGDKTWLMSQIMGIVSGCAGGLSTVVIWLMVISPIPVCFVWPGILLPASLVAFLGGAAKFLFFDIEICRSNLWLPDGDDITPITAESCSLGMDATLSIISSILSLACVLLVCIKAPKRKEFHDSKEIVYPGYGGDIQNLRTYSMEDSVDESESIVSIDIEGQKSRSMRNKTSAYDLNLIVEEPKKTIATDNNIMTSIPLQHRNPSTASDAISVRSAKKALKFKRRVNPESEKLRQAEPSIEYTEKELHQVFNDKANNSIHLPETPPMMTKPPTHNRNPSHESVTQNSSSPFFKAAGNFKRSSFSNMFSPAAPSDESSFIFRSPIPFMKENSFSSPGSSRRSTPNSSKKKNNSNKKRLAAAAELGKKTEQTSNKSQKYDEALIQKCVIDLKRSFSDSQLAGGQDEI